VCVLSTAWVRTSRFCSSGHLAPDAEDYERAFLDAYDAKAEAFGHGTGTERGE
jgi:hypothetical protein